MPRPTKTLTPPPVNSIVASAARMTMSRVGRPITSGPQAWQEEIWGFFDTCGELCFSATWVSNAMSQIELRLMEDTPQGKVEVTRENAKGAGVVALDALEELFDGDVGQAQMMGGLGLHLSLPGEAYLVGLTNEASNAWRVLSVAECKEQTPGGGVWVIERGDGIEEKLDVRATEDHDPDAVIIRIWRPHPKKAVEAFAPTRAAIPILRELEGLTRDVASSIDSRLAGAGILLVPSEMTFQTPVDSDGSTEDPTADAFLMALADAMAAALSDPGSAAARVPILLKAPGEFLAAVKHITFESPLSDKAKELRDEAIRRLALALDHPPEVMLGNSDSNHWNAWLSSEEGIKQHLEPLARVITHGLTTRYLWPVLQGSEDVLDPLLRRFTIEADTSALRRRATDPAHDLQLWKEGVIKTEALIRDTRYEPGDIPDLEETRKRLLEKIAATSSTTELVVAVLEALGIPLDVQAPPAPPTVTVEQPGPVEIAPEEPPPAIEAPPAAPEATEPTAPPVPAQQQAALLAASEVMMLRAIEKGWNRAGRRGTTRKPVDASGLDACLKGAWDPTEDHGGVVRIAALCGVDAARLRDALDAYARTVLTSGRGYSPTEFQALLADRVLRKAG